MPTTNVDFHAKKQFHYLLILILKNPNTHKEKWDQEANVVKLAFKAEMKRKTTESTHLKMNNELLLLFSNLDFLSIMEKTCNAGQKFANGLGPP